MDLIFCISKLDNSGPAKGLIAMANGLSKSHNVFIVYFKENDFKNSYVSKSISKLVKVNKYSRKEINNILNEKNKTRIISMCFYSDFLVPLLFRRLQRAIFIRGNLFKNYWYDYGYNGLILAFFHYFLTVFYHRCLVLNKEEYSRVSKLNKNTFIIPNFIDEKGLSLHTNTKNTDFDFIFVGNLNERKQPNLYVKAVINLAKKNKGTLRAALVGGGPLEDQLKELINIHQAENYIQMIGRVDDVYPYLRRSSVFVLPSLSEGTPRAAMEALAHGNIVILRDVANNSELISFGKTGVLFENNHDLEAAMEEALNLAKTVNFHRENFLPEKFRQSNALAKLEEVL